MNKLKIILSLLIVVFSLKINTTERGEYQKFENENLIRYSKSDSIICTYHKIDGTIDCHQIIYPQRSKRLLPTYWYERLKNSYQEQEREKMSIRRIID